MDSYQLSFQKIRKLDVGGEIMEEIIIKTNYTGRVLKLVHKGIFKNHTFIITHTDDGFYRWYCGYVEIKEEHPYFNKNSG